MTQRAAPRANREAAALTRNRRRQGRLTVASGALVWLVTPTACGGGSSGAAPAANSTADLPQFITCLNEHGVSVSPSSGIPAIRTALKRT
jgi:hypothetical protein